MWARGNKRVIKSKQKEILKTKYRNQEKRRENVEKLTAILLFRTRACGLRRYNGQSKRIFLSAQFNLWIVKWVLNFSAHSFSFMCACSRFNLMDLVSFYLSVSVSFCLYNKCKEGQYFSCCCWWCWYLFIFFLSFDRQVNERAKYEHWNKSVTKSSTINYK